MLENAVREEISDAKDDIVGLLQKILEEMTEIKLYLQQWENEREAAGENNLG